MTAPLPTSPPTRRKWTAAEVVQAIRVAYGVAGSTLVTEEWALLTEVRLRAPWTSSSDAEEYDESRWADTRTIDVLLSRNWSSGIGHRRVAIEVKVSRSDYRNETDQKRFPAERAAHHTYYAAPAGLIDPVTLPDGWGLIEVYPDVDSYRSGKGRVLGSVQPRTQDLQDVGAPCRVRTRAALRHPVCDMAWLTAGVMRRAGRAEERIRRGEDATAEVPALRAEVASLKAQVERRDGAVAREREKAQQIKSQYVALLGDQVCATCGEPIGLNLSGGWWSHRDRRQEGRCEEARATAARGGVADGRWRSSWPGPVLPVGLIEQDPRHTGG